MTLLRVLGSEASLVEILVDADKSAEALAPLTMPSVADRVGVDLAPIDLSDDGQVRWLEALVWPEAQGDRDRLRTAIAIAQRHPPRVLQGDAVTILATLLESISEECIPVVFHSTLFTYLDAVQRQSIAECVEAAGSRRDVCWLPLEAPGFLTRVQPAFGIPSAVATQNSQFVLAARWWRNAVPRSSVLAQVDAYGRSIRGLYLPERVAGSV